MYCKQLFGLELTTSFYQEASQEQKSAGLFEIIIENFMPVNFLLDSVLGYGIYDFNRTFKHLIFMCLFHITWVRMTQYDKWLA